MTEQHQQVRDPGGRTVKRRADLATDPVTDTMTDPMAVASGAAGAGVLTETERAILELEGQLFTYSGTKENRIRELFGWSAVRYFQVLNALIDTEAAEAAYPVTVHRLRRLRESRARAR